MTLPGIGEIVDLPEWRRAGASRHPRSPYSYMFDGNSVYIYHNGAWRYGGIYYTTAYERYMEGMGLEP